MSIGTPGADRSAPVPMACPSTGAMPRRRHPCAVCPIRSDNVDTAAAKFPEHRWGALEDSVREGHRDAYGLSSPGLDAVLFGCHKQDPKTKEDTACAGWLARFGADHTLVRTAVAMGRLDPEALSPGADWPPLHDSWAKVRAHQTLRPGDPTDHLDGSLP